MYISGQTAYSFNNYVQTTESTKSVNASSSAQTPEDERFRELLDIIESDMIMYREQREAQQKINEQNRLAQKRRDELELERARLLNAYYMSLRVNPDDSLLGQISMISAKLRRV